MMKRPLAIATLIVALVEAHGGAAFDSSKLSPGVVVQTNAFQSPKISAGVVVQRNAFQASKLSVGIVVADINALKSTKLSAGVVVQSVSGGGGAIPRAPLTHW